MKKASFFLFMTSMSFNIYAEDLIQYKSDSHTRASDFSREFFGGPRGYDRAKRVDMGSVGLDVSSDLNCGQIDIKANFEGEFKKVQEQIEKMIPNKENIVGIMGSLAMMTTCYAYPTICAELRHDFLSLKANLNLRSQACQAIDKYIDSQAEKGANQLRAEAKAACVAKNKDGKDPGSALEDCQNDTGLGIRDFQSGLEKRFTKNKQKVLASIVKFSQNSDPKTYEFLASLLGEIEVQSDGYWQPLFAKGMLMPNDVAQEFLAEGEGKVCTNLADIVIRNRSPGNSIFEKSIVETIKSRITKDDVSNVDDLGDGDKELACTALGRAIGQIAAQKTAAKGEAIVASGLLNPALPSSLRDEFRTRGNSAFLALKKTVESEQIPTIDEVRGAISKLAYATREKNKLIAAQLSESRIQNSRQESLIKSDCTDTLSCGGL